jgi:hypothetical protein
MRNILRKVLSVVIAILVIALTGLFISGYAQTQKARVINSTAAAAVQQPLFTEYKGIKLGTSAQEVRAKLGNPVLKDDAMDYFIFTDGVTAQFVYDKSQAVRTISIDYAGGTGAPEGQAVVGTELETRPDGSSYRIVRYPSLGFWVSYNRTAGPVITVTITIQKI